MINSLLRNYDAVVKKLLSVLLVCLSLAEINAQTSPFRFDHITIKDGLSQSQAYCIFQDSYNYLWIGTQDGLNRYDGSEFKVFKNDPFDSTTLTHNWVWTIEEDNHGDLWIGTFQGLCKYDRREDKFIQYYHKLKDTTSISGNRPNYIVKDKKGRLWISSWGSGLNLYDEKTNTFRQFLHDPGDPQSLSNDAVRTLFCDSRGDIWVGTWNNGLNRVIEDSKGIRFQRFYSAETNTFEGGNQITSMAEDKSGNLWIGSYQSGLIQRHPENGTFQRVPNFLTNDINKIICDADGRMWIGTNNGLKIFDPKTQEFFTYTHQPANPTSLSTNTIYSLTQDRNGIVWIAGNGLDKYDPHRNIFQHYVHDPANPNSIRENMIWSFCEDDEGKIWIGGEDGPVNVFDPVTKKSTTVVIKDEQGNLARNVQQLIFHEGIFWIASYNSGFIRYDKKTGRAKFYLGTHPSILGKVAFIKEILRDRDGSLWIGTYDSGLIHFYPDTDEVIHYKLTKDNPGMGSNFINALYQDKKGNIWIGFLGGGLSVFDKRTKGFSNYQYDRKNKYGLSDQMVSGIVQENDSIFWIATHTGLNRLNIRTSKFDHFFEEDGLANNVTYALLPDDEGNLWVSTNGGLSKFNFKTSNFRTYTEADGLQSNEFNANAGLKSSTGEFYFGGVNGFNVFNPHEITESKASPILIIQEYRIFDTPHRPSPDVSMSHNENYLTFLFTALEFSAAEKIKYVYKLEGFDKDWIKAGKDRQAHYTNLDPGHYTFRVRASNPDGVWTSKDATMAFVIHPPFWKSWWFISLVVIVSVLLAYGVHRYRLEQSLKVERLRNKIASDLHDEVGSSLTRISIYSDLVQNGTEEAESKNYLRGISELSREVVTTMSDIVWSIDNRYDKMESLVFRMTDFATELLQAKNIEFDFQSIGIDKEKILDPVLKQNLYLIFKEAVNNIVKHAGATRVKVLLTNEGGKFELRIDDDGKGMVENGTPKGNGLRNMRRRAEAIGGTFEIKQNGGTSIRVRRDAL